MKLFAMLTPLALALLFVAPDAGARSLSQTITKSGSLQGTSSISKSSCLIVSKSYAAHKDTYKKLFLSKEKEFGRICDVDGKVDYEKIAKTCEAFAYAHAKVFLECKTSGSAKACGFAYSYIETSARAAAQAWAEIYTTGYCGDCAYLQFDEAYTKQIVKVEASAFAYGAICAKSTYGYTDTKRCYAEAQALAKVFIKIIAQVFEHAVAYENRDGCVLYQQGYAAVATDPTYSIYEHKFVTSYGLDAKDICFAYPDTDVKDVTPQY